MFKDIVGLEITIKRIEKGKRDTITYRDHVCSNFNIYIEIFYWFLNFSNTRIYIPYISSLDCKDNIRRVIWNSIFCQQNLTHWCSELFMKSECSKYPISFFTLVHLGRFTFQSFFISLPRQLLVETNHGNNEKWMALVAILCILEQITTREKKIEPYNNINMKYLCLFVGIVGTMGVCYSINFKCRAFNKFYIAIFIRRTILRSYCTVCV